MINLTAQQLRQAATLTEKIADLNKQLNHLLGNSNGAVAATPPKRTMSAAARARIAAAQKARWAKISKPAAKPAATKTAAAKPKAAKNKMSPAAKAALSAKMKALWAKRKAAQK
jgi:hypothetical protein